MDIKIQYLCIRKGFEGMDYVTSMAKLEQMLELFEREKVLVLTVLKHMAAVPGGLNMDEFEAPIKLEVPVVLFVDRDGCHTSVRKMKWCIQ